MIATFTDDLESKLGLVRVSTASIRPAPENDSLYRPVDPDDSEIIKLAESIRSNGLLEPLVISTDGYIISGHRRYAACKLAGLAKIPCRQAEVSRADDPDKFLGLLREHNRQRNKTFSEKLREELVSVDPEDAYANLTEYRQEKSRVNVDAMELPDKKQRCKISKAKNPMLRAIDKVLSDNKDFWPMNDRQIHYRLLNDPPLKHGSKRKSIYRNNESSYNSLCELLARARLEGFVPWEAITDPTRPVVQWNVHDDAQGFIGSELDIFLKGYARNLLQSQPNHIEVLCEKNTVLPILKPVVMDFTAPLVSGHGFCSLQPRYEMTQRFRKSGKQKLVLLLLSDHDPDGEVIASSYARSMRDDFGLAENEIHAVKVGLTSDQVRQFKLPQGEKAKKSSTNYPAFAAKYGEYSYELESLEATTLQGLLRDALDNVIDTDAFNAEVAAEKADAAKLEATRRAVQKTLPDLIGGFNE